MDYRFSVLIPVYYKEKPEYFSEALASVIDQTLKPSEIVVVKDGPLTEELEEVISKFSNSYPGLFKIVALETNQGLGIALAEGVKACSYELIARMDSDDISREDRFEKQIAEFEKDPDLDICGSQIAEFEGTVDNVVSYRIVPTEDNAIKRYQKMRSAFNHVTVVYKKSSVLKAGNYQPCEGMEDGLLYVNMFLSGARGGNLPETLMFVRVGDEMYRRRGNLSYFHHYLGARKKILMLGYINRYEYLFSIIENFFVSLLPTKLRSLIYRFVLHSKSPIS